MIAFTHQMLSRKNQRQKSDNASANIVAAVLRCPSLCCAWAKQKSFSFNQAESYTPLWRGAWQRTRHQGEMWPLQMVTAAGRCSLSHRQKHRNLQCENLQFNEPNILSSE